MNLREFYIVVGGDYEEAFDRMRKEERIVKFLNMFLADTNYDELISAVDSKEAEKAFRAAHTLKGVAGNLGLTNLQKVVSEITETLRGATEVENAIPLIPEVKETYQTAKTAIEQLEL